MMTPFAIMKIVEDCLLRIALRRELQLHCTSFLLVIEFCNGQTIPIKNRHLACRFYVFVLYMCDSDIKHSSLTFSLSHTRTRHAHARVHTHTHTIETTKPGVFMRQDKLDKVCEGLLMPYIPFLKLVY